MFRSVVFRIQIGGDGGCEAADTGDDVVLEYKTGDNTRFVELQLMTYNGTYTSITNCKRSLT